MKSTQEIPSKNTGFHEQAQAKGRCHEPGHEPGHGHHHHHHHDHDHDHGHGDTACCHEPAPSALPASPLAASVPEGDYLRTQLRILQMDCPTEERLISDSLGRRPDVIRLEFNLMQRVLTVVHTREALEDILQAIRSLGFTPEQAGDDKALSEPAPAPWWPLIASGIAALAAEVADWAQAPVYIPAILALLAVMGCGLGTYRKGWTAIRNRQLNINALMSIAVTGALFIGQWAEAAMVMVLYTLAERIEALSLDRARNAVQGLMQLSPDMASVRRPDGQWLEMPAGQVSRGAIVRVRPGARIALDGEIIAGASSVDQSPITGESLPVDKAVGDQVFAGTINGSGMLEFRVLAVAAESTLARIIRAIETAQSARAPTQRFVDRFARVYTPLVVLLAVAIAILPPLLGHGGWFEWVYKALVLLVIACPCALVISTPVTIVSGLAAAARHGVLVKGGVHLEQGRLLRYLALDKTGTITRGRPVLVHRQLLAGRNQAESDALANALATGSDHPVSFAVSQGLGTQPAHAVNDFQALPGRGVQGVIEGQAYMLGNHRLIHESGMCSPELETLLESLESQGQTVVMLATGSQVLALYAVADTVKPESAEAVAMLHEMGVHTVMLSGDNPHTVAAIAARVGINEARGDLLPEDKLQAIAELSARGASTGMVGDGINDAPALARADTGFAMGAMGTDTAMETADVALMDDDLRKIPWFMGLSQASHRVLVQNIALALGIKLVVLILALAGLGTLWMAVFADVGASLLVVANGLRLLRHKGLPAAGTAAAPSSLGSFPA